MNIFCRTLILSKLPYTLQPYLFQELYRHQVFLGSAVSGDTAALPGIDTPALGRRHVCFYRRASKP